MKTVETEKRSAEGATRSVEYLGSTYEVPDWACFIAADSDGDVWLFEKEPEWCALIGCYSGGGPRVENVGHAVVQPPLKVI